MVVMTAKRRIELRIRGSHAPPNAEDQAREMLKSCCKNTSRASYQTIEERQQPAGGINKSQVMAEITITKHGPHG
jgi:hypothetical protein